MNVLPGCCDLCGLPLSSGAVTTAASGRSFRFCCTGCKQVFSMLFEAADGRDPTSFRETDLFKKCREMGLIPRSEADLLRRERDQAPVAAVPELDSDSTESETEDRRRGLEALSQTLKIDDMWCPACAWVIEEALKKTPGVMDASCDFSTDRVRCDYNPVLTSPAQLMSAIDSLGYKASISGEGTLSKARPTGFIRLAISAFLTMNVMMLSFGLYAGFFTELSRNTIHNLSWPAFFMASIVVFYGGKSIYQRAWAGISSAAFSMETLITVGTLTAYLYSTVNLISGSIHLYYDTASMLITLVLLGKALEGKAKGEVQEDLENFFALRPRKVKICTEGFPNGHYVAAERLRQGDIFRVEEGELLPADGLLIEGRGSVNESFLTGEPLPITKKTGDRLMSGSKVLHGVFKVKAEGVGEESTLGQMIAIMERALGKRTPLESKTDRALQWFVPIILVLAAATGVVSFFLGLTIDKAMIRAVTVMVIACPCTLGIAIPMARVAGISLAGRKGVLVRDFSSSFDQAERVNAIVFDKTGTVTYGQWELLEIIPFEPFAETQALAMATALERNSDHYIGTEIKRQAERNQIKPANIECIRVYRNGISGWAGKDEVKIGSRSFLAKDIEAFGAVPAMDALVEGPERSYIYMSYGGRPCAVLIFGDRIKEGASSVFAQLLDMGYRLSLISGDGNQTTQAIAGRLGIEEAQGGELPQDKASYVRELQRKGYRVSMVGDGINDAPALAQSDLAVAVYSGSHLGKETGDITLMRGDPRQLLDFIGLSKRVNRKIRQNLIYSFIYNIIAIPVAMSGFLNPLIAVCAMLMSSLTVTCNTLLLIGKERH